MEVRLALMLILCFLTDTLLAFDGSFYANNELEQTVIYRSLPKKEKREMQREILSLLGLHHRPKPSVHGTENSAPRYMIDLYKSFIDKENHDEEDYMFHGLGKKISMAHQSSQGPAGLNVSEDGVSSGSLKSTINDADVIMSFVNHAHHDRTRVRHDKDKRFWFDVSEVPVGEDIMDAELRLYRQPSNDRLNSGHNYTINVYELMQGPDPEDRELRKLSSISVPPEQEGWLLLNVTSAVSNWVAFPHNNLGLFVGVEVHGRGREVSPGRIGIVGNKGPKDRQPFMTAFFKTPTQLHIRKTRAAKRRQKKQSSNPQDYPPWESLTNFNDRHNKRSCQRKTLYVSFRDLGWQDWIIAPDGYAAFYCFGECSFPLNAHMNATNHAIVQTLVHLMNPYSVPKPCCAPTKLSAISVLYFDDNSNVILKKYKNMVVKTCGCH